MSTNPGPHDLQTARLILGPGGRATVKAVTDQFYVELESEFNDFVGHSLVSQHKFDSSWPTWEMHPKGDEFVYLLDGDTDLILLVNGIEQKLRMTQVGTYAVIPRGTWHTARPYKPTTLLFITPGEGTENEEKPPTNG